MASPPPLRRAAALLLAASLLLLTAPAGLSAAPEEEPGRKKEAPPAPAAQGAEPRAEKGSSQVAPVHIVNEESADKTNLGFIHAFVAAISVIIVSELGDKTFFIAAIMAMRYNRLTVLAGAMLALGLMTCLSVLFGYATTVIPRVYTYYVSTALFAIFGIRMLREGLKMSPDEGQEELEEVQAEIKKKDEELQRTKLLNGPGDVESGPGTTIPQKKWLHFISPIFVQAFTLTFLAEWGDRSQLTTIVLAAREDPYGVAVGGTVGHCLCTGLAVIGGRMIAQKISVRTVLFLKVPIIPATEVITYLRYLYSCKEIVLRRNTAGSLGFSIVGGYEEHTGNKPFFIKSVVAGTPAYNDGRIRCGDILLAVNGRSTSGMMHACLARMLKELKGKITLTIVSWPGTFL